MWSRLQIKEAQDLYSKLVHKATIRFHNQINKNRKMKFKKRVMVPMKARKRMMIKKISMLIWIISMILSGVMMRILKMHRKAVLKLYFSNVAVKIMKIKVTSKLKKLVWEVKILFNYLGKKSKLIFNFSKISKKQILIKWRKNNKVTIQKNQKFRNLNNYSRHIVWCQITHLQKWNWLEIKQVKVARLFTCIFNQIWGLLWVQNIHPRRLTFYQNIIKLLNKIISII